MENGETPVHEMNKPRKLRKPENETTENRCPGKLNHQKIGNHGKLERQ